MRTLFGEAFGKHAANPRAPAALAWPSREMSYADLVARVRGCAAWLAREGCVARAPVGISVASETDCLVVSLALLELGVPQVGFPTHTPEAMRRDIARRLAVARIVVDDPRHALPGIASSRLADAGDLAREPALPGALDPDPDAPALFAASSGTTGQPKIIALTQRMLAVRAQLLASSQAFAPDERLLVAMSVQEYPGRFARFYAYYVGCTTIEWPAPAPPSLTAHAIATRASTIILTAPQAAGLADEPSQNPRLPDTVRVILGASRMPNGLPARFEARVGGRLYNRYGTSEVGLVTTMFPDGDDGTPDSVGRVLPGIELEIVDAGRRPLPRGEPGEIRLRGDGMVAGYYDDPATTAKNFVDGWFYPRDVGAINPDGVVRFLGRVDDMMLLHGINIFPAEIERVLESHPAVATAAAFAIPSRTHGEIPAAAVELNGKAEVEPAELAAYAREHLGVRAPRKLVILDALPRNAAGKVVKREIAKRIVAPSRDD